jgi:hypothetical protein
VSRQRLRGDHAASRSNPSDKSGLSSRRTVGVLHDEQPRNVNGPRRRVSVQPVNGCALPQKGSSTGEGTCRRQPRYEQSVKRHAHRREHRRGGTGHKPPFALRPATWIARRFTRFACWMRDQRVAPARGLPTGTPSAATFPSVDKIRVDACYAAACRTRPMVDPMSGRSERPLRVSGMEADACQSANLGFSR